jgi:hypothetical protein
MMETMHREGILLDSAATAYTVARLLPAKRKLLVKPLELAATSSHGRILFIDALPGKPMIKKELQNPRRMVR